MTDAQRLDLYTSVVPNERQLALQRMGFYAFVHYGINTFTGREWGTGKESERLFNPKRQNTDQWCEAIRSAGMGGVILTCKHHDGFCLWQTKTTEHSIKNSPYKNGKGDVVRELSESCKKYGLKFGIYLSPWDRNAECYGTPEYNDFYIAQLTELLTNYGEIFILWLDGACGAASDGKSVQKYDFERIWSTALKLQPGIVLSGCAPDVRWIGNESGKTRKSEWNVVPKFDFAQQNIDNSQTDGDMKAFQKRCVDAMAEDLGSRQVLKDYDELMWYPAEADVSIRRGWFYHRRQDLAVKSLDRLMSIYYNTVGGNALFLLNIPPNKNGLFSRTDVKRLAQMGRWIEREKSLFISDCTVSADENAMSYTISFERCLVDRLHLSEDTTRSQRVESFGIYANGRQIYSGTVIGFGKIAVFNPIETDCLTLKIHSCRNEPHLERLIPVKAGAYRVKRPL